jgi:cell division protein FtsW
VNDLKRVVLPTALALGPMAFLIVIEPDLGSSFMLALTAFVMLFVAGLRWKYVGAVAGAGALGVVAAVIAEPYRMQRILTFLNPMEDTQKSGFQLAQSLIALGSGGVLGTGWGQGQQKAFYLPAAHTDFIYSVIGEELGLVGTIFLLAAFLVLFWRGMRTAAGAPDRFGYYLALGITTLVAFQALIHMGVCIGILPTKGLPLPLVSHGGSSLVATMAALGVLVNVSRHSN